jgi:hypothetical protein
VYVPVATSIVSPSDAFPIAALIVAHGLSALEQELPSLPPGATYHGPAAYAGVTPMALNVKVSRDTAASKTKNTWKIDLFVNIPNLLIAIKGKLKIG